LALYQRSLFGSLADKIIAFLRRYDPHPQLIISNKGKVAGIPGDDAACPAGYSHLDKGTD